MTEDKKHEYGSTVVVRKQPTDKPNDDQVSNLLEQYKHFADVTLAYWKHLESVNQFFLSLHTAVVSAFAYLLVKNVAVPRVVLVPLVLFATLMAIQWFMIVRSLQKLNAVRHEIIQEWEESLPAQPYRVEYHKLYEEKRRYLRLQDIYKLVPLLAILVYLVFAVLVGFGVKLLEPLR